MGENSRQGHSHEDQKSRQEAAEIEDGGCGGAGVHKVVVGCIAAADGVGERSEEVGRYDEEGGVLAIEGGGENDEEEADG